MVPGMSSHLRISGRVIAAARALSGISQAHLAKAAGLDAETLREMEAMGSAWIRSPEDTEKVRRGLDHFGVVILDEEDGMGAGVRLKFTRSDVRQLTRLESEGGAIGSDDAP